MRDPLLQCREEFTIYSEIFAYILADLKRLDCKNGILTEGAAYVPGLMKPLHIPHSRYIAITPAKEFQIFHYSKMAYVPYVPEGCRDTGKAFSNWMERDALFAQEVQRQCRAKNYVSIVNDGSMKIDDLANEAALHFGF